jgi:hypothetical protein
VAAAQTFLTGAKKVTVRERDGSAYRITFYTYKGETPVDDWAATNLIPNGGFETDLTGWQVDASSTMIQSSAIARYGAKSALWTITSPATGNYFYRVTPAPLSGPTAGRTFTCSIYAYAEGAAVGKKVAINVREFFGVSSQVDYSSGDLTLVAGWNRLTSTHTFVANDGTFISFWVVNPNPSGIYLPAGSHLYFDAAQIEENPAATPYIPTDGAIASRPEGQGPVGAALRAQKAAGLILAYHVLEGQTYLDIYDNFATYQSLLTTYDTYDELLRDQP